MDIAFEFLERADKEKVLPKLFDLLYENMSVIAPSGCTREEDKKNWLSAVAPALDRPQRRLILIKDGDIIAGFFMYYVNQDTFMMEEIQFAPRYQGTGLFEKLYGYLAALVPEDIKYAEAYAHILNEKSQRVLEHLGLEKVGMNQSGHSYHYRGDCGQMLAGYR